MRYGYSGKILRVDLETAVAQEGDTVEFFTAVGGG